ncbi:hypothetical protein BIW11_13097, partial [Tropilaelaps mercedesae]
MFSPQTNIVRLDYPKSAPSISVDAHDDSTSKETSSAGPRSKQPPTLNDDNKSYAKIEQKLDRLIQSCALQLGDPWTTYSGAIGDRKGSGFCPKWLRDMSYRRRPYSSVQLVVGELLDVNASVISAFSVRNADLRKVGKQEYELVKISAFQISNSLYNLKTYPHAHWRVRVGTTGSLAKLRVVLSSRGGVSVASSSTQRSLDENFIGAYTEYVSVIGKCDQLDPSRQSRYKEETLDALQGCTILNPVIRRSRYLMKPRPGNE